MADSFGCLGNNLPFTYLGVKVGDIMTRVNSWIEVPEGILSHLEKLHNKFFLGADPDDRKITWVSWKKVLAHKNQGGLGTKVIKSIHGNSRGLQNHTSYRVLSRIIKATIKLKDKGIDLMKFCKLVIGNGNVTRFWHDRWLLQLLALFDGLLEVVKKVSNKLSFWKAKSLSVGGRLTLIKSVLGAIPTYYMSLFRLLQLLALFDGLLEVVKKVSNKLSFWKAKSLSVGGRLTLIKSVLGAIPTYYM
ncbi:hypothetical protein Tco_1487543, partial [Tanacetum coccineum]